MMVYDAKVTLTSACNARCATCPVWRLPSVHMPVDEWHQIWRLLNDSPNIRKILLNNTGDVSNHPEFDAMMEVLTEGKHKWVAMTTNAAKMPYIPTGIDELVISFNGGTKSGYERTTGLDFEQTVDNIRALYDQIAKVKDAQLHCLIWEGNAGEEDALVDLWSDFPGRVRISYKYDNQMRADHTVEAYRTDARVPCDYIYQYISIFPGGGVRACAHDFYESEDWGNVLEDFDDVIMNARRFQKLREHCGGVFNGVCERCNYNRPVGDDLIRYVKE